MANLDIIDYPISTKKQQKVWLENLHDWCVAIDIEKFKKQIFDYTNSFKFNKVVSSFMILLKENKHNKLTANCKSGLIQLLRIYMPSFTL